MRNDVCQRKRDYCWTECGEVIHNSGVIRRWGQTLPDVSRILFDQRISEGDSLEEVRQEPNFHEQVERIDRRIESYIPDGEPVFFDRGLADNLASREHFGNAGCVAYDELKAEVMDRYDSRFLLDRLEFKDDEV